MTGISPNYEAEDLRACAGWSRGEVARLAFLLEVLNDQIEGSVEICGGPEDSGQQDPDCPGVSVRHSDLKPAEIHALARRLQRAGVLPRGALGLYTDRVYLDGSGVARRGFGDDEDSAWSLERCQKLELLPGLEWCRLFPDGDLAPGLDDGEPDEETFDPAGELDKQSESSFELPALIKQHPVAIGVGAAAVLGGAMALGVYLWRRNASG